MALKILQPGLRPLGQFPLDDDIAAATKAALCGGEVMIFNDVDTSDPHAADVSQFVTGVELAPAVAANLNSLAFLTDEGIADYGTLFGSIIGSSAGQATSVSGATVIGPRTDAGSGKITCWHAPGLYGLTGGASVSATDASSAPWKLSETLSDYAANDPLGYDIGGGGGVNSGKWCKNSLTAQHGSDAGSLTTAVERVLGYYVGDMQDESLVSTSNAAAGASAVTTSHAIYYLGAASQHHVGTNLT